MIAGVEHLPRIATADSHQFTIMILTEGRNGDEPIVLDTVLVESALTEA
jgi:hypothetical protein